MRNTGLGTLAGLFGGFVLSSVLIPPMFFGAINVNGPGVGFFLGPVVFFGCVIGGGVVGALIGSRVPVRVRPPEDPERRQRRVRAMVRGGLIGFFVGFFGGFLAFAASKIVFDWRFDNFGVEGAIFFGSAFGGAGVGAAVGALVGRRVRR
jgi:hypothetical protein